MCCRAKKLWEKLAVLGGAASPLLPASGAPGWAPVGLTWASWWLSPLGGFHAALSTKKWPLCSHNFGQGK